MPEKDVDLVAEASVLEQTFNEWGWPVQVRRLDKAKLQRLRLNAAAMGRSALSEFYGWLMLKLGLEPSTARQVVQRVWTCRYEYQADPTEKLFDYELSWSYRKKLFDDLRKFLAFLMHQDEDDIDEDDLEDIKTLIRGLVQSEFWDDKPPEAIVDRYRLDRRK